MKQQKRAQPTIQTSSNSAAPTLFELVSAFFLIGLTAYSMAMLEQLKALVVKRGWLSQEEVDDGLAMVQLYPGPIFVNLAVYVAYRLRGFVAAVLCFLAFLLPSYLLMVGLSYLYFHYADLGWVHPLFIALEAMVVGIVIHVALDFAARYVKDPKTATIAALAFLSMLYRIDAFAIILLAIIAGIAFFRANEIAIDTRTFSIPGSLQHRLLGLFISGAIFVALLTWGLYDKSLNGQLLFSMFKVGAIAFGNGMTIMPLLQQEVVFSHHWLSLKEFADGIAFGQVTPGPFLITAVFIGYKLTGIPGSILATIGIFYPSFFYTLLMSEIYSKIKHFVLLQKALRAILAAFTGMIFFVALSLGEYSLNSQATFIWCVFALVAVRYFRLNILWVFAIGITAEVGLYLGGWHVF